MESIHEQDRLRQSCIAISCSLSNPVYRCSRCLKAYRDDTQSRSSSHAEMRMILCLRCYRSMAKLLQDNIYPTQDCE